MSEAIPRFSIYYNNGDVVHGGGEDDELVAVYFSRKWLEAPSDGVNRILAEVHDIGRDELREKEYFYQMPMNSHGKGCIGGSMKIGPFLRQGFDSGSIVKFGGWTDARNHRNTIPAKAHTENTWVPPQTATRREPQEDTAD